MGKIPSIFAHGTACLLKGKSKRGHSILKGSMGLVYLDTYFWLMFDDTHRIHVWYIYLHLVDVYGKCRYKYTIHGCYGIYGKMVYIYISTYEPTIYKSTKFMSAGKIYQLTSLPGSGLGPWPRGYWTPTLKLR